MWLSILPFLVLGLLLMCALTAHHFGAKIAAKHLASSLIVLPFILIVPLAASPFLKGLKLQWDHYISTLLFILLAPCISVWLGTYITRAAQAGDVLLDIALPRSRLRHPIAPILFIGFFLFFGIMEITLNLDATVADAGPLIGNLSFAGFVVLMWTLDLVAGFCRSSIRNNGILVPLDFIKWDKIKSFRWRKGGKHSILVLNVERFPRWWPWCPPTVVPVSPEKRDAVTDLLERHLTARSEGAD